MLQLCEPAVRPRRLSAEEFCLLARREASGFYRPRSEVLRMLTVGQAAGVCGPRGEPLAAMIELPLTAGVEAAGALRQFLGRHGLGRGVLLGPPVGDRALLPELLDAALTPACRHAGAGPVWAALEATPEAEELLPVYLEAGLALRAARPLSGLAPCWLFARAPGPRPEELVWVPLADRPRLAALWGRGWAAVASETTAAGTSLGLCPL